MAASSSSSSSSPSLDVGDIVRLNVGGQVFVTTRSTLLSEPDSMLGRMFAAPHPSFKAGHTDAETNAIFIDRSPRYFEPVLHWLRTGTVAIPSDTPIAGVRSEAEFFQIRGLLSELAAENTADLDRAQVAAALACGRLASLQGFRLAKIDLSWLNLDSVCFAEARIDRADFNHSRLSGCSFIGARGQHVNFQHARASKLNVHSSVLPHAKFDGADLSNAILSNSTLSGASCTGIRAVSSLWQKAGLQGVDFTGSDLTSAHLQDANLQNARLLGCTLTNVHLSGADLRGVEIDWSQVASYCFNQNRITAAQYESIPYPNKDQLQFIIVDLCFDDDPIASSVLRLVRSKPVVVYGQFAGIEPGSRQCDHLLREDCAAVGLPPEHVTSVEVGGQGSLMNRLSCISGALTFPMIWIAGQFYNGAALKALNASGELKSLLTASAAASSSSSSTSSSNER